MRLKLATCVWLIAFALAGCSSASLPAIAAGNGAPVQGARPAQSSTAIISGTVSRGPLTPNQPGGSPGNAPVAGARIDVSTPGGTAIASAQSDPQGNFRVAVPPGTYTVTAPGLRARPATVTVSAGEEKHVDIAIDTGIY